MNLPFIDLSGNGQNEFHIVVTFILATLLSSFAGLAALLRTPNKPTNIKNIITYMLNSGILGLIISLLWYFKFKDNIYFLIGLCVAAGLGGLGFVEQFLDFLKSKFIGGKPNA